MDGRLDNFDGSPDDYVTYLEETIILLRQHHSSCSFAAKSGPVQSSTPVATEATTRAPVSVDQTVPEPSPAPRLPCNNRPAINSLPQKRFRGLEFVAFDPTSVGEQSNVVRQKKNDLRWKDNALALIRDTPQAENWHQALKDKGLYDILCSGSIVVHLLDTKHSFYPLQTLEAVDATSCSGRLDQIKRYATATMQKQMSAGVALALADFQMFLVLSSCAVLLEAGDAPADIFEIVRICIGRDTSERRCKNILKACRYLNRLADSLYMRGWGLRAGEAILLCTVRPTIGL